MTNKELIEVVDRWNDNHVPEDFELLYRVFQPLITRIISRYQPDLHYRELAPGAISAFLSAVKSYDYPHKNKTSLYIWVSQNVEKAVKQNAGSLLYPGLLTGEWTVVTSGSSTKRQR